MKSLHSQSNRQAGFAHLGIILAIVGILGIGSLVVWRFMSALDHDGISLSGTLSQKLAGAKCDYDDKEICKFFVSWKEHKTYKMETTSTLPETLGGTSKSVYEVDGDNIHVTTTGKYASEMIIIGDRETYTKSSDGTWWKQSHETADSPSNDTATGVEFDEPSREDAKDATVYKALGKEACGDLTCFKYQVTHKDLENTTQHMWFDTKSYKLRRTTYASENMKSDTTFTYEKVTVKAPSSFKELGPNQFLMPGEDEPTTMPSASDYGM